jgi:hypothetical protein
MLRGRRALIPAEEYLTIAEVAAVLKVSPKRVQNMMAAGVFRQDEHFFRPPSMRPRFKRSALTAWIERKEEKQPEVIPLSKGVVLRIPNNGMRRNS